MPPKGSKKGSAKRKADDAPPADPPAEKSAKTDDADEAGPSNGGSGGGKKPDAVKAMNWLLSSAALDMITDDEVGTASQRSYRSSPGSLSPYEELLCCMMLAKPVNVQRSR